MKNSLLLTSVWVRLLIAFVVLSLLWGIYFWATAEVSV
ncbi:Uncharacterised protein [Kingella negevensis]|uniref:Uncharacterized protein n=1 Tax=Kingella negevensis TaxID=1522312 RepID=A0A238TG02_9NEIS|nr:Uncharacterised protein [Kingella negevensis]